MANPTFFIWILFPLLTPEPLKLQNAWLTMGKFANPAAKLSFEHEFVQIIDGKPSATERTRHGVNPANLEQKPEVPVASSNDVDRAVAAAQVAFKSWSNVPYSERRKAVLAYADAVDELRSQFRDLLISEQGKPVRS